MTKFYPAAYQANKGSALDVDRDFYQKIADATDKRELVEAIHVPIRTGQAWVVPAGHVFRIVAKEGAQVGDLNMWNLHNPRERMWASYSSITGRTRFYLCSISSTTSSG
jgi:uncharacterized protein YcgI (DUF1989 family)